MRDRDQADRKRERVPELFEGEQKAKRIRRMEYSILGEDWGSESNEDVQRVEDGDQHEVVNVPVIVNPPLLQRRNKRKKSQPSSKPSSSVADYFVKLGKKKKRMETITEEYEAAWIGTEEDQNDFAEMSDQYLINSQQENAGRSEDEEHQEEGLEDTTTTTTRMNSTGGSSWLGTQEDREDFAWLSDQFLISSQKSQGEDGEEVTIEDDIPRLDSSGGSSWMGTQEDRDDFAWLSDQYLASSTQSGRDEDDLLLKEDDRNDCLRLEDDLDPTRKDCNGVNTILTSPGKGQDDLRAKNPPSSIPAEKQEDGPGEPEKVPDNDITEMSSSTTTVEVGVATDSGWTTTHTDTVVGYDLSVEGGPFEGGTSLLVSDVHSGEIVATMVENTLVGGSEDILVDDDRRRDQLLLPGAASPTPPVDNSTATPVSGKQVFGTTENFTCIAVPALTVERGDPSPTQNTPPELMTSQTPSRLRYEEDIPPILLGVEMPAEGLTDGRGDLRSDPPPLT